jgi:hypothetical protein
MTQTAQIAMTDRVRALLKTARAPSAMSTLVTLTAPLGPTTQLTLSYVPDRLILTRDSFAVYAGKRSLPDLTPETLAATIADDIANEIVPKWQRVTIVTVDQGVTHTVAVEDRQPGWQHPTLLSPAVTGASI